MEHKEVRDLLDRRRGMGQLLVWPQEVTWITGTLKFIYFLIYLEVFFFNVSGAVAYYGKEMGTVIINSVDSGVCLSALSKMVCVFFFPYKFHKVIKCLEKVKFPPKEDPLYVHLEKKLKINNLLEKMFRYSAFGAITSQGLAGVYATFFGDEGRRMVVKTALNDTELPLFWFWFIFLSQYIVGLVMAYQTSYFDCTSFAFISFAVAKLRILKSQLLDINDLMDHNKLTYGAHDEEIKEKLKECIREQVILEQYVDAIQDAFSIPIFAELSIVLLLVSINLMSMVLTPFPSIDFFLNIFFLFCFMLACAGFCFHGNELIVENEEFWQALYFLDWHYFGASQRKTLFIMMERRITPLQITAGSFVVLSNETFLAICNTAFSYFTIILNLYSEE